MDPRNVFFEVAANTGGLWTELSEVRLRTPRPCQCPQGAGTCYQSAQDETAHWNPPPSPSRVSVTLGPSSYLTCVESFDIISSEDSTSRITAWEFAVTLLLVCGCLEATACRRGLVRPKLLRTRRNTWPFDPVAPQSRTQHTSPP